MVNTNKTLYRPTKKRDVQNSAISNHLSKINYTTELFDYPLTTNLFSQVEYLSAKTLLTINCMSMFNFFLNFEKVCSSLPMY